jgi:hypothetical protein
MLHTYTHWLSSVGGIKFQLRCQENLKLNTEILYSEQKRNNCFCYSESDSHWCKMVFPSIQWAFFFFFFHRSLVRELKFCNYYDIKFAFPFLFLFKESKTNVNEHNVKSDFIFEKYYFD